MISKVFLYFEGVILPEVYDVSFDYMSVPFMFGSFYV